MCIRDCLSLVTTTSRGGYNRHQSRARDSLCTSARYQSCKSFYTSTPRCGCNRTFLSTIHICVHRHTHMQAPRLSVAGLQALAQAPTMLSWRHREHILRARGQNPSLRDSASVPSVITPRTHPRIVRRSEPCEYSRHAKKMHMCLALQLSLCNMGASGSGPLDARTLARASNIAACACADIRVHARPGLQGLRWRAWRYRY